MCCKVSEPPLSQYLNCIRYMSCNAVVCGSVLHVSLGGPHYHFTFCHDSIVRSHQLCFVELHSLAHFDVCVAFDRESEIQFVMFC